MCDVNAYNKEHVEMPDDESSDSGRPMSSTSYNEALISLG